MKSYSEVGGSQVILVLGYHKKVYLEALHWREGETAKGLGLETLKILPVTNPTPEKGQFTSIQCGVMTALALRTPAIFLSPIDVPIPDREVWDSLQKALVDGIEVCQPSHKDKLGHPVLLANSFLQKIHSLSVEMPEARLDHQIALLPQNKIARVKVDDDRIGINLNRKEDFEQYEISHFK